MRLLILILCFPLIVSSQFNEQFTDGELKNNPTWFGDTNNYKVNATLELQLDAPTSGSSELLCASQSITNARWTFKLTMDFNPSASNYCVIYLVLSNNNISSSKGYYLFIGGSDDEISLFYKDGNKSELIIDGQDNRINTNPVDLQILVERDSSGLWSLSHNNGNGMVNEGSSRHDSLNYSRFFGIQCNYTSTRSDKFYFDDLVVTGDPFLDTIPPKVLEHRLIDPQTLHISFNEPLEINSVSSHSNYELIDAILGIDSVILDSGRMEVSIHLDNPIPDNDSIRLDIQNFEDSVGNKMKPTTLYFFNPVYANPAYRQIMINEIMLDPEPPVNLPEIEYLEIRNITNKRYRTDGWKISDLTDTALISNNIIEPFDHIILCDQNDSITLNSYGKVFTISNFPSLNNAFDKITLFDSVDSIIDSITYSQNWINDSDKKNGGWSLERNSKYFSCSSSIYWSVSSSPFGGTPGWENSNWITSPIPTPKLFFKGTQIDRSLVFKVKGNTDLKHFTSNIKIEIDDEILKGELKIMSDSIVFIPNVHLDPGVYKLSITGMKGCFNNTLDPELLQILIPDHPKNSELIINEILFNPKGEGSDFVEVYNSGSTPQDLQYYSLGGYKHDSLNELIPIIDSSFIILPGDYVVLSENPKNIMLSFPNSSLGIHLECKLPAMNNSRGSISLVSLDSILEQVHYDEKMHFDLITDKDGVSLERISPFVSSDKPDNWHSASENSGYGTPGMQNSQFSDHSNANSRFSISPEIFSPDNDGYEDVLNISYNMNKGGYLARIRVIDRHGREVAEIVNNYQLGRMGHIFWDGVDNTGHVPIVGVYFLLIETYLQGSQLEIERIPVVVGQKLDQ